MLAKRQAGLTLIELVVAIVVIALGVSAVLALLSQGFRGSPDPQLRIKTIELAQAYMGEIFDKKFDHDGKETSRSLYNDLEDYDGLCEGTSAACDCSVDREISDSEGNPRGARYSGYCVQVKVWDARGDGPNNDSDVAGPLAGVNDDADVRRVEILVTEPRDFVTTFAAYRLDF